MFIWSFRGFDLELLKCAVGAGFIIVSHSYRMGCSPTLKLFQKLKAGSSMQLGSYIPNITNKGKKKMCGACVSFEFF